MTSPLIWDSRCRDDGASMVTVRDARADDAPLVAWDLETATGQMFSLMLGGRWEQILTRVVSTPGHAWSLENARIAENDGKPLGVILSSPSDLPAPDDTLGLPWGWVRLRLTVVGLACQPFLSFMARHGASEWYITAISVKSEARGQGVGSALMGDAVERARAAGMTSVTLDVDEKNSGARRLYEREGFVVQSTSPTAWLAGGVRVQRMRLGL